MTVSSLTQKISYDGDGTATALAVPFSFWDETDLYVYEFDSVSGFEALLLLGVDYTVTGGAGSSGTVIPAATRASTVRWTILRGTSKLQTHDYQLHDPFPSQSHEDALDRLTQMVQDTAEQVDRGMKIPVTDSPWVGQLPSVADRAGKQLLFDSAGEPVAGTLVAPGALIVTPFVETILDDADDAAVRDTIDAQEDVITARGDLVRGSSAGVAERLPLGADGKLLRTNGADAYWEIPVIQDYAGFYPPRAALNGFVMANGTDATNDIDVGPGIAHDSTYQMALRRNTSITKRLDATWAAGTAAGGLADGLSIANAFYHVFIIGMLNADCDVGFDTSPTAANLMADAAVVTAGFVFYRRIGTIQRASAAIRAFVQDGDEFLYAVPLLDIDIVNLDTTAALQTLSVPPDVKVQAIMNVVVDDASGGTSVLLSSPDMTNAAASYAAAPGALVTGSQPVGQLGLRIRTNTSRQIRARSSDSSTTLKIVTLGYVDSRGKGA